MPEFLAFGDSHCGRFGTMGETDEARFVQERQSAFFSGVWLR